MDDDPDLLLIDDGLYQPPSPLIPTILLPPRRVIPDEEEEEDDSSSEVDPSRILLPPSPIPPEEDSENDSHPQRPLPTTEQSKGTFATPEEKQCRICFGGEEDEDDCGRLISPCVCTGSMRVSILLGSPPRCRDDADLASGTLRFSVACSWWALERAREEEEIDFRPMTSSLASSLSFFLPPLLSLSEMSISLENFFGE